MYVPQFALFSAIAVFVSAECENGWTRFDDSCYFFGHEDLDFFEAEGYCVHFNAHLANIETATENTNIRSYLRDLKDPKHWIGMTDEIVEGVWQHYPSETKATFLAWGAGEPNQAKSANCVAIWESFDYLWIDEPCTNRFKPLCEKPLFLSYVDKQSNHPNSVKKTIPYGLGIRLKRICTDEKDYRRRRDELKRHCRRRGYSGKFLENQLQRADDQKRELLIQVKSKEKKTMERVPLVITYGSQLPDINGIVRKNMKLLQQSERMSECFRQPPIDAFRRDRNLGDLLVHGKLNKVLNGRQVGTKRTCKESCLVCEMCSRGVDIRDEKLKMYVNGFRNECKMWNLIYGISCTRCERFVYVGETGRSLNERMKEHVADVRHRRAKPVGEHFSSNGHSEKNMGNTVLETMKEVRDTTGRLRNYNG